MLQQRSMSDILTEYTDYLITIKANKAILKLCGYLC